MKHMSKEIWQLTSVLTIALTFDTHETSFASFGFNSEKMLLDADADDDELDAYLFVEAGLMI